jgi:hypothetical protein
MGPWTAIVLRGSVEPDNIEVLLTAVDAVMSEEPTAIMLDGDQVDSWSVRGLEVAVHTAIRTTELRVGFAMSGLGSPQVELIRRHWPGVPVEQFSYPTAADALRSVDPGLTLR